VRERTLSVVSAVLGEGWQKRPGPRKDYAQIAEALGADILDLSQVEASPTARVLRRVFGAPVAEAWLAFRARSHYRALLTDGEHIGIPLALLLKLARDSTPHVMIGHRLSAPKKRLFFRWLKVQTQMSRVVLHSRSQYEAALRLGIPAERLALVPYQVDTDFWRPQDRSEDRLICSAGLEFRDYPTLLRAVDGLDIEVVIGAASGWSRCRYSRESLISPANVRIGSFDSHALRELYARSALVVVPLYNVDFQAGVTTLLEAMAMGKAVVVTQSRGQTDVVIDRRRATRADPPRPLPVSLLQTVAAQQGERVEPNGLYVPPCDPPALRRAIVYLLDHPDERRQLGASGRRAVQRLMTVDQFGQRVRAVVEQACAVRDGTIASNNVGAASGETDQPTSV
jgi:glycosyltransferase involved in cell wall biosynthesis